MVKNYCMNFLNCSFVLIIHRFIYALSTLQLIKYLIQRTIQNFLSFNSYDWPCNPIEKYKFCFSCIILSNQMKLKPKSKITLSDSIYILTYSFSCKKIYTLVSHSSHSVCIFHTKIKALIG